VRDVPDGEEVFGDTLVTPAAAVGVAGRTPFPLGDDNITKADEINDAFVGIFNIFNVIIINISKTTAAISFGYSILCIIHPLARILVMCVVWVYQLLRDQQFDQLFCRFLV
jgi:hypothetical protein